MEFGNTLGHDTMILGMRHRPHLFFASLFALLLAAFLAVVAGFGAVLIQKDLETHTDIAIEEIEDFSFDILGTMKVLAMPPAVAPCSEPFVHWLREVAFRPDRINEILYAPNGMVSCTINQGDFDTPVPLGLPDFILAQAGKGDAETLDEYSIQVWQNIDFDALALPDSINWLMGFSDFVLAVPDMPLLAPVPDGVLHETVWRTTSGRIWHRAGTPGLYASLAGADGAQQKVSAFGSGFSATFCDATGSDCIAVMEPVGSIIDRFSWVILGAITLALVLAATMTFALKGTVERSWSLDSRVRHRLSARTVACVYQPMLDLRNDQISSIEVLARWRDDDGTLVAPGAFLPVIEQHNLQRKLTRLVVDRAYRELSQLTSGPSPLNVHFNIFPSDFDPDWMIELFTDFLRDKARFTVIIELVESDALPIDRTRAAVARLKKAGILTFIDDFGEGYSSIGYLAGLGTYGVKLDRSFGMAPEGSLMDVMMDSAIEMVSKTEQVLIVEGVETLWRLSSLKANPSVALAQGYYISRPVDISTLDTLLGDAGFWPKFEAA